MTDLTPERLAEMRRVAEAATQGEWRTDLNGMWVEAPRAPRSGGGHFRIADIRGWGYFTGSGSGALGLSHDQGIAHQTANAAHIVTFDPPTTIALLDALAERDAECQHSLSVVAESYARAEAAEKALAASQAEVERMTARLVEMTPAHEAFNYNLRPKLIAFLDEKTSMDSRECIHVAGAILNFARAALSQDTEK